jgi:tetratricopeptide (TPR) repeat protein
MFGWFESQSTLTAEQRRWIDDRFTWLRKEFGEERLRGVVVTPTDEFFPDRYEPTAEGAATLLDRLCGYMDVDRTRIDLRLYANPSADAAAAAFNPGLPREFALGAFQEDDERIVIWLEQSRLTEPHSVVSTLAHELGHVHLLADKRCDQNTPDHEPLTDLLTVYFGLGVFVANTAIREAHWRSGNVSGWSVGRQGYLSIPDFAYALALYAHARGENRPSWLKHLRPDLRAFFKTESKHLAAGGVASDAGSAPQVTTMVDKADAAEKAPTAVVTAKNEVRAAESDADDLADGEDNSAAKEPRSRSLRGADWAFTRGTIFAAEGLHERAVEAFSQALQANPRDSEAWLLRAQSHLNLGHFSEVLDDCSWSLAYEPDGLAAQCCRAQAYLWLRQYDQARNEMDQARRIDKRDPQVYYLRGLAHLGLGNNRQALADLKRARRFAPTWAGIYLARSRAYKALGKTNYAAADLAEAIRREPEYADTAIREDSLAGRPLVDGRGS